VALALDELTALPAVREALSKRSGLLPASHQDPESDLSDLRGCLLHAGAFCHLCRRRGRVVRGGKRRYDEVGMSLAGQLLLPA
jgi:hypothetical protein